MRIQDIISEDDTVIKGPWKDGPKADNQGYGTMHDMHTGEKVAGPRDMSKMKSIPARQVFGKPEYNTIMDMGYKFDEKPSEFSSIRSEIPKENIAAIQRKIGRELKKYYLEDIIVPYKRNARNPQNDVKWSKLYNPNEETVIIEALEDEGPYGYNTGDLFLGNRSGAKQYIRMWAKLV